MQSPDNRPDPPEALADTLPRPRVLIADADAGETLRLATALGGWGFEVLTATDGQVAWQHLSQSAPPLLAVLSARLPGRSGAQLCEQVRGRSSDDYTYLILITDADAGGSGVAAAVDADDYLTRPIDAEDLRIRLRAGQRLLELQADLLDSQAQLLRHATRDTLTGTLNRTAIIETLDREQNRSARTNEPLAILLAELDPLAKEGSAADPLARDDVHTEAAARMQTQLRCYDSIGRYGRSRFLLLLPGCEAAAAQVVAERIRQAVAHPTINTVSGPVEATVSTGVAVWCGGDWHRERFLHAAGEALAAAQNNGGNQVLTAGATMRLQLVK